ncbi:S4 domain-containing protein [uncultured Methylophaga sp.]|uniref:RNA-binding S4 domain-containing protein n=1 Tax=uncultured Methylophaga sp. TaxID=285271 RepID=UPI00261DD50D|nr:S4 domain-containing protein [uncultured Methylophaga sp.]
MTKDAKSDSQRLDKWLWAARFYKTRGLAVEAISGGKVHLNSQRIKPSRTVRVDDTLTISKPPYEFTIVIQGLNLQRRPATEAQMLYQETEESIKKREILREQIKNEPLGSRMHKGRPSKRDRRNIIRFTRQG